MEFLIPYNFCVKTDRRWIAYILSDEALPTERQALYSGSFAACSESASVLSLYAGWDGDAVNEIYPQEIVTIRHIGSSNGRYADGWYDDEWRL